jgi:hypothetical protein
MGLQKSLITQSRGGPPWHTQSALMRLPYPAPAGYQEGFEKGISAACHWAPPWRNSGALIARHCFAGRPMTQFSHDLLKISRRHGVRLGVKKSWIHGLAGHACWRLEPGHKARSACWQARPRHNKDCCGALRRQGWRIHGNWRSLLRHVMDDEQCIRRETLSVAGSWVSPARKAPQGGLGDLPRVNQANIDLRRPCRAKAGPRDSWCMAFQ